MSFFGWFSPSNFKDASFFPLPDISRKEDLLVERKDQCLDELEKNGEKRGNLIHDLTRVLTTLPPHTLNVHVNEIQAAFQRAQELREQTDYLLNQYIATTKPGLNPQDNGPRHARIWSQIQKQDTEEASCIHEALREGRWIKALTPSASSDSPTIRLSAETVSAKVARFAKANWMTVLGLAASGGLSLSESLLPQALTSFELYSPAIPALLGAAPLLHSLKQTTRKDAADFGLAIGRAAADSALPGAAAAAITAYCYDPENSWAIPPLLGIGAIAELGSIYCNMPTAKTLCNHALTATEKWFEYGALTGIPMAIAATAASRYFEQSFLTNAGWLAFTYALHAIPAATIAASKPGN